LTASINAGGTNIYEQQGEEGSTSIWKYAGTPYNWTAIDDNPETDYTIAYQNDLYEMHNDGSIWYHYGSGATDWLELDNNPQTATLAESGASVTY
jgi:hypothetical protein